jgi:threonine synthase
MFSSANSINVGRLVPQVAYYINSYCKLLEMNEIRQGDKINIVVPTGNFGNILAAYYARGMGLPVNKFICAANENNVLNDFFNTGVYNRLRQLKLTISPSMDILVSSNLERLIYDICDRDSAKLRQLFEDLSGSGIFSIDDEMMEKIKDFWSGFATDSQTIEAIREVYKKYKYLIDTHTGVGYHVYKQYFKNTVDGTKTILASTANPFKFPASLVKAISDGSFKFKNLNDFQLLDKLSELTGILIPAPLRDIGKKKILHRNFCKKNQMKDFVAEVLHIH